MHSQTRIIASVLLIAGALTVLVTASNLALAATTTTTTALTIVVGYDAGRLMFEGWGFTPGGVVTGYIDGKSAWDSGPVCPDGHVFGVVPILLSPGQHSTYLVDVSTGKQSNTTTLSTITTTSSISSSTTTASTTTTATSTTTTATSTTTTTTSTPVGTAITIAEFSGKVTGSVTVKGYLKDAKGNGLQGLTVRITVDGWYGGIATAGSGGYFSYTGPGPTSDAPHVLTVWFDGGTFTVPVGTTWPNIYVTSEYASSSVTRSYTPSS